jgi:beta-mannosidase
VVWCGNNEIEEGDWHWEWQVSRRLAPHYALFHKELPRIAQTEAPQVFYWISSPYSPDRTVSPRETTQGDQHPWMVSIGQSGGADWWWYRTDDSRFPNEGGVLGCSTPATLRDFLPPSERRLCSLTWEHHDNPFAINGAPNALGRAYETVRLWTGLDPFALDYEQYAFVSGLLQAEGLTEYITNYRRRRGDSSAAIFWMFNDSWPTTHGWTIVDYYRRKKLSFHPVRRAFAPISLVVAPDESGKLWVYGVNDTREEFRGSVRFVSCGTDGMERIEIEQKPCLIPVNGAVQLGSFNEPLNQGRLYFAVLYTADGESIAQHRVLFSRFHELNLVREPEIDMSVSDGVLTLRSEVFCWGVCLDAEGDRPVADNVFDLLPGISYHLPWNTSALGEPRLVRLGNRDALFPGTVPQM